MCIRDSVDALNFLIEFKARAELSQADFVTLCGNGCFMSRLMEDGFIPNLLDFMDTVGIKNTLKLVSDTGGGGLRFIKHPHIVELYTGVKRKRCTRVREWIREHKRGRCI